MIDRSKHRSVYRGERDRVDAYARPRWWCCSPHQLTPPLFLLVSQFPGPLINKQTSVLHKKPRFVNNVNIGRTILLVDRYVSECEMAHSSSSCMSSREDDTPRPQWPLISLPLSSSPREMTSLDILGSLPKTKNGSNYIILFVDLFSRHSRTIRSNGRRENS